MEERFERIEKDLAEAANVVKFLAGRQVSTEERIEQGRLDLAEAKTILKHLASRQAEFEERNKRIERHLEVLIETVDGLIRDRRFRELEQRVQALEGR